jgi:hypothetical protein
MLKVGDDFSFITHGVCQSHPQKKQARLCETIRTIGDFPKKDKVTNPKCEEISSS